MTDLDPILFYLRIAASFFSITHIAIYRYKRTCNHAQTTRDTAMYRLLSPKQAVATYLEQQRIQTTVSHWQHEQCNINFTAMLCPTAFRADPVPMPQPYDSYSHTRMRLCPASSLLSFFHSRHRFNK